MDTPRLSRRELLLHGRTALAGLAFLHSPLLVQAFPRRSGEAVIPWVDQPPPHPRPQVVSNQLKWEELDAWITPNAQFFRIAHYQGPLGPAIDERQWKLEITGHVKRPLTVTLSQLKARPRQEVIFTLECSGNHGFPFFIGGIGTAKWAGTPLAPLLQEAGVLDKGIESVRVLRSQTPILPTARRWGAL